MSNCFMQVVAASVAEDTVQVVVVERATVVVEARVEAVDQEATRS